ncbi:MAG: hypothetical protein ABW061_06960 [Polyangiaceae bacterium]
MWAPCPYLLVLAIEGHGHAEFAAPILAVYRALDSIGPVDLFADLGGMTNYESGLRTDLTAGLMPTRKRIASFPILLHSKLVAMGVTVANLALGGFVQTMNDRALFKRTLDAALFRHKAVGFSSAVLETPRLRVAAR